jgi:addiction module RelE/StbE family toxin
VRDNPDPLPGAIAARRNPFDASAHAASTGDPKWDSSERSELEGLAAARAVPGFRDQPLKGEWQSYRAVRLSDAYRAIYTIRSEGWVEAVYVEEVNSMTTQRRTRPQESAADNWRS